MASSVGWVHGAASQAERRRPAVGVKAVSGSPEAVVAQCSIQLYKRAGGQEVGVPSDTPSTSPPPPPPPQARPTSHFSPAGDHNRATQAPPQPRYNAAHLDPTSPADKSDIMFNAYSANNTTPEPHGSERPEYFDPQAPQKAGVAVGVIVGLFMLVVLGYFLGHLVRKHRKRSRAAPPYPGENDHGNGVTLNFIELGYLSSSPSPPVADGESHLFAPFAGNMPYPYSASPDFANGHRRASWTRADQPAGQDHRLRPANFLGPESPAAAAQAIAQPDPAREPDRVRNPGELQRGPNSATAPPGLAMPAREHGVISE